MKTEVPNKDEREGEENLIAVLFVRIGLVRRSEPLLIAKKAVITVVEMI